MTHYTTELNIVVDLNVIAKYHSATKVKVDNLKKQGQTLDAFSDSLTLFIIKDDQTDEIHPAFNYWKYAESSGLDKSATDNLLYILYANCLYEWNLYSATVVSVETINKGSNIKKSNELDLNQMAIEELTRIKDLSLMLERKLSNTELKFDYISQTKRSADAKRDKHKVLSVTINDKSIVESALRSTLVTLFNNAKNGNNDVLREALKGEELNHNTINDIIQKLHTPPANLTNAIIDFRRYLIKLTRKFLKQEANINIDVKSILSTEALMIYSLFSLLRLIDTDLIEKHTTEASRKKYIRSMAHNTGNLKPEARKADEEVLYFFDFIKFSAV